jgi:hypothetical protein
MREWAEEMLAGLNPEALFMDGFDEAIIGVSVGQSGQNAIVVYDQDEIVRLLVAGGADIDDAWEYYSFNVEGAYVGPHTPIIITRPSSLEREAAGASTELER